MSPESDVLLAYIGRYLQRTASCWATLCSLCQRKYLFRLFWVSNMKRLVIGRAKKKKFVFDLKKVEGRMQQELDQDYKICCRYIQE